MTGKVVRSILHELSLQEQASGESGRRREDEQSGHGQRRAKYEAWVGTARSSLRGAASWQRRRGWMNRLTATLPRREPAAVSANSMPACPGVKETNSDSAPTISPFGIHIAQRSRWVCLDPRLATRLASMALFSVGVNNSSGLLSVWSTLTCPQLDYPSRSEDEAGICSVYA